MSAVEDLDQERRITFCLYDLWDKLVGESGLPALKRMSQKDIAPFKKNLVLIDLRKNDGEPTFQVIGQELQEDLEVDLSGQPVSEVPRRTMLSRVTDHYLEVLANRVPIAFEAEFVNRDSEKALYRGILLPFSDDNKNINFILGGVRWILEKDVQLEDGTPSIEELMKSISSGIADGHPEPVDIVAEEISEPMNVDTSDGFDDAEGTKISGEPTSDIGIATDQDIQDNREPSQGAESGLTDNDPDDAEIELERDVEPSSGPSHSVEAEVLLGEDEADFDDISPDVEIEHETETEPLSETIFPTEDAIGSEDSDPHDFETIDNNVMENDGGDEVGFDNISSDASTTIAVEDGDSFAETLAGVLESDAELTGDNEISPTLELHEEDSAVSRGISSDAEDDPANVEENIFEESGIEEKSAKDEADTIGEELPITTDGALSSQEQAAFDRPDNETNEEVSTELSPEIEETFISDDLADEPQDSLTLAIEETHPFEEDIVNELTTDTFEEHDEVNAFESDALSEDGIMTEPGIEEEAAPPIMGEEDHSILTVEMDDKIIEVSDVEDDIEDPSPNKDIDEPTENDRSADETPEENSQDVIILPDETEDLYSSGDKNAAPADDVSSTNDIPITGADDDDRTIVGGAMEEDEDELILEKAFSEDPDRDDPFASRGAIIFDALAEEEASAERSVAATPEKAIEPEGLGTEEDVENDRTSHVNEQVNVEIGANEPSIEELMQSIIKTLAVGDSEDTVVSEDDQTNSDAFDDTADIGSSSIDKSTDPGEEKAEIDELDKSDFHTDLSYEDPNIKPNRKSLIERAAEKEALQNIISEAETLESPTIETVASETIDQTAVQKERYVVEPVAVDMTGARDVLSFPQLQNELKQIIGYIKKEDSNHNRSRDSLYNILTAIYKFHHTCQTSVDAFEQLVAEDDLKIQARAPFTPVLKVCLGKDYDKTRLTEYAAALGIAKHMGIEVDEFHSFIKNFPGGIKGCVQEMRSIRKHGTSATVFTHKNRTVEEAREILRNMTPIGQFRLKKMIVGQNMDEFCLLLAKRDGHAIDVLKILDDKYTKLEPILKRTAFIKGNLNESK